MSSPSSTSSSELAELRAFVLRTAAFLVLSLCAGVAASAAYTSVLWRTDHAFRLQAALEARVEDAPEVLVLGDSHPRCAVDPDELGDAFVYAVDGESLLLTAAKLEAYLATGARPGCVLIPADVHCLDGRLPRHVRNKPYWARHVELSELVLQRRDLALARRWIPARWGTWLGSGDTLFRNVRDLALGGLPPLQGPSRVDLSFAERSAEERTRNVALRIRRQLGSGVAVHPDMVDALSEIADLCRRAGVPLVLVRYPVTAEYLGAIPERARAAVDGAFEDLAAREDVTLVDLRAWNPGDLTLYRDADHLNPAGAVAFSRDLRRRLVERGVLAGE